MISFLLRIHLEIMRTRRPPGLEPEKTFVFTLPDIYSSLVWLHCRALRIYADMGISTS